jgi:hypothetical protein
VHEYPRHQLVVQDTGLGIENVDVGPLRGLLKGLVTAAA